MPRYEVLCEATARSALVVDADSPEDAYAAAVAIMQSPEPPPLPDVCGPCGFGGTSRAPWLEIGDYELASPDHAVVEIQTTR